jgi:hypothetical protein
LNRRRPQLRFILERHFDGDMDIQTILADLREQRGGLSMSDRSSPRSKTVLVYTHDHAALQVIRDLLEPLGLTVEVASAPEINSVANPS